MQGAVKVRAVAGLNLASGALFVLVPLLVEFVSGEFFLLVPVAFLVLPALGICLFLGGIVFFVLTEAAEQSLSGTIPWAMDVAPPLGLVVAGLGLLHVGRAAWRLDAVPEARTAPPSA